MNNQNSDSEQPEKNEALALPDGKRIEKIKNPDGETERLAVRGRDGKFLRTHDEAVKQNMRSGIKILQRDDPQTPGVSRQDRMRLKIYDDILAAPADELVGTVKGAEYLENSSFGKKAKDNVVDADKGNTPVWKVEINIAIPGPVIDWDQEVAEQKRRDSAQPPWAKGEVIQQNPAPAPEDMFRYRGPEKRINKQGKPRDGHERRKQ